MREGRTYSSITSWWLKGALYCHGQWRVRGSPPTRELTEAADGARPADSAEASESLA